jgi:hypothetical protein
MYLVNDSAKLQQLLDYLTDLLFRTWSAFLLAKNLDPIIDSNDLGQERYLFSSVYVSCVESVILGFSTLMSNKDDEISIGYLLNMCHENNLVFTKLSPADVSHTVQLHRQQLAELKPLIQQVKLWRDKAIAHLDKKFVNDPVAISKMQPVEMEHVGPGIILLQTILNVYREWLGMHLLRLQKAETEMTVEWEYLVDLIKRNQQ